MCWRREHVAGLIACRLSCERTHHSNRRWLPSLTYVFPPLAHPHAGSKERWETREVVRQDTLLEEGTFEAAQAAKHGGEVVRVGVVVGAEAQRERLESLIRQRAELTGESVDLRLAEAGFGGMYGGKSDALGGHAAQRFKKEDGGLVVKGKRVAQWQA